MLNLEMDLELRFIENFESSPSWTWRVNHWLVLGFFGQKNEKNIYFLLWLCPQVPQQFQLQFHFHVLFQLCTQYVGTKMGVVSFVYLLLTFPWFSCKSGIWNYSKKTTKHKINMPFRQIATKRCNILGNSSLNLCH